MTRFKPDDQAQIKAWNQNMAAPVSVKLILSKPSGNKDKRNTDQEKISAGFSSITEQLSSLTSNIDIETLTHETKRPGFELTDNIYFSAFPLEKELFPFLNALSLMAKAPLGKKLSKLPDEIKTRLDKIQIPVRLKLYIALFCPHCPKMVETLMPLALYCDHIHLDIIDGSLFEAEAQNDHILSAPCLILDNDFRWTGQVTAQEIIDMAIDRDPAKLSSDTLQAIMEKGDASWIAQQMIVHDKIFDAFVQLLCHKTWSVRLGAMVVVEELAADAPALSDKLCPLLIEQFDRSDIPVQGDLLYALGEAGNASVYQWIEKKMNSFSHPDLLDAAKDALSSIQEK